MSLLALANELLLFIAEELNEIKDLYSFLISNRRLAILLPQTLYRLAARRSDASHIIIIHAAASGNKMTLRTLLENVTTPMRIKTSDRKAIIHKIPRKPNAKVISRILEEGANLTIELLGPAKRFLGAPTALRWAVRLGHTGMVRFLLENGAKVSAESEEGWTALHEAVAFENTRIVEMLLEKGADTAIEGKRPGPIRQRAHDRSCGDTPLAIAIQKQHIEIVRLILKKVDANLKYDGGSDSRPLHAAVSYSSDDDTSIIKLLLDKGADIGHKSTYGLTALYLAVKQGKGMIVRLLLDEGARIDTLTYSLIYRPDRWDEDDEYPRAICKLLIEKSPVTSETFRKKSPLHVAVECFDSNLVRSLLERGADVNMRYPKGQTPLHMAAWRGDENLVKILVEYGADVNSKDRNCETALHAAMKKDMWDDYAHGKGLPSWKIRPRYKQNIKVIRILLDAGIGINSQCIFEITALHRAVENHSCDEEIIKLLLEKGANPALRTKAGSTALEVAFRHINLAAIKILGG